MADRVLTWFVEGSLADAKVGTDVAESFWADHDYVPTRVRLRLSTAGIGEGEVLTVDINDDGTSIFTDKPGLADDVQEFQTTSFPRATIRAGSVITLDLDEINEKGAGADLTVQLELDEA